METKDIEGKAVWLMEAVKELGGVIVIYWEAPDNTSEENKLIGGLHIQGGSKTMLNVSKVLELKAEEMIKEDIGLVKKRGRGPFGL